MRKFVPYTEKEKEVIMKSVGVDSSDSVGAIHDEDAVFVVNREMRWLLGDNGKYTGWWKRGTANGRGTWREEGGNTRVDAVWRDGTMHGWGRNMWLDWGVLFEGIWEEGKAAEDGSVLKYTKATGTEVSHHLKKGEW